MTDAILSRADDDGGADLEQGFAAPDRFSGAAVNPASDPRLDFFVTRDGMTFAGTHLIIDLYDAESLDDPKRIETVLVEAARRAGATVLSSDFHHFQPNGGVSGVVVLAESHISIHTWPERGYAALDVFMCGECRPIETVGAVKEAFRPSRIALNEIRRGVVAD
jgi:S-adenosylmethionine decarboxylase